MTSRPPTHPWVEQPSDRHALEAAAQGFRDQTLKQVKYVFPATRSSLDPYRKGGVDEIDFAVDFVTEDGSVFRAAWHMFDIEQGLLFGPASVTQPWKTAVVASDVSDHERWRPLVGKRVQAVGLAWQVPEEGASESVWAVRIELEERKIVVVALGTIANVPQPVYQPDAVVVIFDEEVARSYVIPASSTSALGT